MKGVTVASIVIVVILVLYVVFNSVKDNLDLKFDLEGSEFNLMDLIKNFSNEPFAKSELAFRVKNDNNFSIKVKDFSLKIFYEGKKILETVDDGKELYIERNSISMLKLPCKIYTNESTISLAGKIAGKKPVDLVYEVEGKLGFIPLSFKGKYKYESK